MDTRKLIPYSVYLPEELHKKLKDLAKERKASELIRNAIQMIIDGHKEYDSGYNQAVKDAIQVALSNDDAMTISVMNKKIGTTIANDIQALERKK
jgi:metal-responsive CopG/Arc/MetJ family transcriptional regulator